MVILGVVSSLIFFWEMAVEFNLNIGCLSYKLEKFPLLPRLLR